MSVKILEKRKPVKNSKVVKANVTAKIDIPLSQNMKIKENLNVDITDSDSGSMNENTKIEQSKQKNVIESSINQIVQKTITEEYNQIFQGIKGHMKLFYDYYKDKIILPSVKGEGHYHNQIKNIWEKKENECFINIVSDFLEEHILSVMDNIKKDKDKTEDLEKLIKILIRVRGKAHPQQVWELSRSLFIDSEFHTKMNKQPNLLPIKNGKILDLKFLEVRLRKKEDYFDFELPFEFNSNADLSNAEKFFSQIMNDKEVVDYLQILLGYCLTGETKLRCILIFWGKGSNGKSTLCDLLKNIMKKFHTAADKKIFIKQERGSSHTSHLMPLLNSRVAVLSETERDEQLNEGLIKALTGNDEIPCRELYGKQFSFIPQAKYIMLTNNKPIFDVNSTAMIDRIRYIPFKARFVDDQPKEGEFLKDTEFIDKLLSEYLNEVFIWLCIGANKYYQLNGILKVPQSLQDAKNEYINEIDNVSKFIQDNCNKKEGTKTKKNDLYESYKNYCIENAYKYLRNSDFYKRLEILGHSESKIKGTRYIKDLEFINNNYID